MKIGVLNYHYFKLLRLVYNNRKKMNLMIKFSWLLLLKIYIYIIYQYLMIRQNEMNLVYNNSINENLNFMLNDFL
jgi:hypothetical protein